MSYDNMSADDILAISKSNPEKLFSEKGLKSEYMKLRSVWHPDHNEDSRAAEVFDHIMQLYKIAKQNIKKGYWKAPSEVRFTDSESKNFRFKYLSVREFELGKMYIGNNKVMYVLDKDNTDLFENGIAAIKSTSYPKPKFRDEFEKLMPKVLYSKKTDVGNVVVMEKPADTVLLQDLIDYMPDNKIDPKHVAWMVGALYNITTFLDMTGITHNSILPTTLFVSPEQHTVHLLGGWWYSAKVGTKLKAVPTELKKVLPKEVFDKKIAKTSYDRSAVKGTAIACLGDSTMVGSRLLLEKDLPKPMLNWLRVPSMDSALAEFKGWDKTLIDSFGKRKFIKLDVDINDIYKQ